MLLHRELTYDPPLLTRAKYKTDIYVDGRELSVIRSHERHRTRRSSFVQPSHVHDQGPRGCAFAAKRSGDLAITIACRLRIEASDTKRIGKVVNARFAAAGAAVVAVAARRDDSLPAWLNSS
jgi:hypothetical protein